MMNKRATIFSIALLLMFAAMGASAQLLNENFNYSGNLTANGWSGHSGTGTNALSTVTGLSYTGYIGSAVGNAAFISNLGGEDANVGLVDSVYTNGQSVYTSFMLNVTDTSSDKTGDYFFHLGNRANATTFTSFAARVFVKITAGKVNIGVSNLSTAGAMKYSSVDYVKNTTYLVIMKYTINTSGVDTVKMWIKASGVPASEAAAGAPDAVADSSIQTGQDIIDALALRQGSSTSSVGVVVDGIRVDTTWTGAVGSPAVTDKVYSIGVVNISGETGNFATLKAAADSLNNMVIDSKITFYFTESKTYTEPENVAMLPKGTSASKTVTFKPYTGVTAAVHFTKVADNAGLSGGWIIGTKDVTTTSATNYGVTANDSTSHIIIDGSNSAGGTSRDLTISTAAGISGNTNPIRIMGNVDDVTIKNLIITTGQSVSYAINITPRNFSSVNFIPDNITIENCDITNNFGNAAQGIGVSASGTVTAGVTSNNIIIRNNLITARTRGMLANAGKNYKIYGNEFRVNQIASGSFSHGIYFLSANASTDVVNEIYNNKFTQLSTVNVAAGEFGISGLTLSYAATFNIYNNTFSGFTTAATGNGLCNAIRLTGSTAIVVNAYYNSFYIPNVDMNGMLPTAGLVNNGNVAVFSATSATPAYTATFKNNIMVLEEVDSCSAFLLRVPGANPIVSDYNVIHFGGTNGTVGYTISTGAIHPTLAAWTTATSQDANSKSGSAQFVSSSDLHINATASQVSSASNAGTPIGGITTDIDGDIRDVSTPDIGADEFVANPFILAPKFSASPSTLNFQGVLVNKSKLDSVVVKNTGNDSLHISNVVSTDGAFTVTPTTARLDSGASTKFYITFSPTAVGLKAASVIFTSNVAAVHDTVRVSGTGSVTVSIAEARKDMNNDLIPDYSVTKDTLFVHGVISSPNFQSSGTSIYMQDATAGINVFSFNPSGLNLEIGDSVFVIGTILQFRGLTEISPLSMNGQHFGIIQKNVGKPAPRRLFLKDYLMNAENYEGQLIQLDSLYKATGTWPAASSNGSIYLTNGAKTDTVQMFIDADTHLDGWKEPKYPLNIVGIAGQYSSSSTVYNNGYQILPRDSNDIKEITILSVNDAFSGLPLTYELYNNYPNPFNPSTTILYGIPQQSKVEVKIYTILGQEVKTLVSTVQDASYYKVEWNGTNNLGKSLSSGVYFIRITASSTVDNSSFVQVKKMMMMK